VSYTYFPSEAYHVERMLHIIFGANYELNEQMLDRAGFKERIEDLSERNLKHFKKYKRFHRQVANASRLQHRLMLKLQSQSRQLGMRLRQLLSKKYFGSVK